MNLKGAGIKCGYSKSKLAQRLDIQERDINNWENGTTKLNAIQVYALACVLNIDADLLTI